MFIIISLEIGSEYTKSFTDGIQRKECIQNNGSIISKLRPIVNTYSTSWGISFLSMKINNRTLNFPSETGIITKIQFLYEIFDIYISLLLVGVGSTVHRLIAFFIEYIMNSKYICRSTVVS